MTLRTEETYERPSPFTGEPAPVARVTATVLALVVLTFGGDLVGSAVRRSLRGP